MDKDLKYDIENTEIEDKNTILTIRTKESLKETFKNIDANTDNEKLISLLEIYKKFQDTQEKFNISMNLDSIEKAFNTIKSQVLAIETATNQYERTLNQTYIVDIADEMKLVKEQIENEEILNAKITNLEKSLETSTKELEDKEQIILQNKEKIENLEVDNNKYIALNNELVSKESDYVNQLREKDNEINSKRLEINQLVNTYEEKMKSLEEQYKANLKEFEDKLIEYDKVKLVIENKIENLLNNISNLDNENKELKDNVERLRKEHKLEIKELEKEHKSEIKELEKNNNILILEKTKLEAQIENLEKNDNGRGLNALIPKDKK